MSDLPWEIKKGAGKEPPNPFEMPSLDEMPDFGGESATPFDIENPLIKVSETDVEKPPELAVIDRLSDGIQGDIPNEEDRNIPSFDDVFELDKSPEEVGETDLPKSSPPPLFEPKFSQDDDLEAAESIELPKKAPNFEVYGQEQPETTSPLPPAPVSDSPSPFPPASVSDSLSPSPFPPASVSDSPSPFPPTSNAQIPTQPYEAVSLTNNKGKKTIDGIVASIRNMLKGLMRGGSLIDRMEELREEVETAEE
ncbi:MAG TPA: hypothetical protein C5S51_05125, partial [Methanosarcinaceae archaeon]|nr:hypothetical protein [Methanosarcinaceae archaeon]